MTTASWAAVTPEAAFDPEPGRWRRGLAESASGGYHTCGIRTGGILWCWGLNVYGQLGLEDTRLRRIPKRV